jgi:hypothetical protein
VKSRMRIEDENLKPVRPIRRDFISYCRPQPETAHESRCCAVIDCVCVGHEWWQLRIRLFVTVPLLPLGGFSGYPQQIARFWLSPDHLLD